MANRFAVANGDWSNTATWDGGTLPTSADDVYANNFNITCDITFTVVSITNNSALGITAGGTFNFNTPSVTANLSNTVIPNTGLTSFILITASSGSVTINAPNGTIIGQTPLNSTTINYTGNCDLTINCIRIRHQGSSGAAIYLLNKTSLGILTVNGIVEGGGSGLSTIVTLRLVSNSQNVINGNVIGGSAAYNIQITSGNLIINGDVFGGGNSGFGVISTSGGTITVNGSVTGGSVSAGIQQASGNLNITGNITGGSGGVGVSMTGAITLVTGTIIGGSGNGVLGLSINNQLNHIGICQAGTGGSALGGIGSSNILLTGPFLRNGSVVANACQSFRINTSSNPYFEFRKSDNTSVTYVDQDIINFPTELDVREGTTYASGLYTGTLAVPLPSNVRVGIATDDTVGTADLTAEDFFDAIATSTNDIAIRLRNVATVETTGDQIANL